MIRLNRAGPRALLAAAVVASSFGGNVKDLAPLLPVKIAAFAASGPDAVFDRKTLYDYMDGGAEVFLAFTYGLAIEGKRGSWRTATRACTCSTSPTPRLRCVWDP